MKKLPFFLAFAALLLANILVYSCQKETTPVVANPAPATEGTGLGDRSTDCPSVTITNGAGLSICGIDLGSVCNVCSVAGSGASITASSATYGIVGASVITLSNPTGTDIVADVDLGCGVQSFTVGAGKSIKLVIVSNAATHCCRAVQVVC